MNGIEGVDSVETVRRSKIHQRAGPAKQIWLGSTVTNLKASFRFLCALVSQPGPNPRPSENSHSQEITQKVAWRNKLPSIAIWINNVIAC